MYDAIASIYDKINKDIDYAAWADFVERAFSKYLDKKPELVLDLACGTGSMTVELAKRGYDMIGVDLSEDMLNEAYMRSVGQGILYLCQDMREFELYGTVGAAVCCLDSMNYLTEEGDLERCLSTLHNYLDPDGLLMFDVNTPYKFKNVYADNAYILEDELDLGDGESAAVFCGWQNSFDEESGICDFYLTVFEESEDGSYIRREEQQKERCYSLAEIKAALLGAGFEYLGCFGDFSFGAPEDTAERWYIVARAKK
ncbi:MAG: class I SAM-dependent methyltransferase [Clostridia bacterium]|nr:class I SAM-dependent methyltransferase [Clostridia bacterium]